MKTKLQSLLHHLISNPKQIFLIDGFGALVTTFSLAVVLVIFESHFGMPRKILYILSFAACIFAIYSFSCALRMPEKWQPFLKAIAIMNFMYCCATFFLLYYFYENLTILGLTYFILEIIVILILVKIEFMLATKTFNINTTKN
jgi:hypothetical protein